MFGVDTNVSRSRPDFWSPFFCRIESFPQYENWYTAHKHSILQDPALFFRIFRVYILGTSIKSIHATHGAWKKLAGGREKSNFQKSSVASVIYPIYCQEPRGFVFKSISDRVVNRAVEGRGQVSFFSEIGLRIVLRRFLSAYPAGGDWIMYVGTCLKQNIDLACLFLARLGPKTGLSKVSKCPCTLWWGPSGHRLHRRRRDKPSEIPGVYGTYHGRLGWISLKVLDDPKNRSPVNVAFLTHSPCPKWL